MTIQYLHSHGAKPCEKEPLIVSLDGRLVGEIRKVTGGYQYFPKGAKKGGEIFRSVGDVKRSLSDEE